MNLYGSGIAMIEGEEYPFKEGTIFCIPPETKHRKIAENGFIDACIFIKDFTPVKSGKINVFEDDTNNTFRVLLNLAFDIQMKNEPNAREVVNSLGDAMYQLLISWGVNQHKRNAPAEKFQSVLLQNISNSNFNIADEMKKMGYCSRYFRKLFKDFTGYSPLNYLNHLRIEYSKKQLQQYHGIHTIKEISVNSGFSDPYYFSRVFKQHEGISPQHYINRIGFYDLTLISRDTPMV